MNLSLFPNIISNCIIASKFVQVFAPLLRIECCSTKLKVFFFLSLVLCVWGFENIYSFYLFFSSFCCFFFRFYTLLDFFSYFTALEIVLVNWTRENTNGIDFKAHKWDIYFLLVVYGTVVDEQKEVKFKILSK